jgi:hypothetical protein
MSSREVWVGRLLTLSQTFLTSSPALVCVHACVRVRSFTAVGGGEYNIASSS